MTGTRVCRTDYGCILTLSEAKRTHIDISRGAFSEQPLREMNKECFLEEKKVLPRLPELDGLRGLAALMVFAEHFYQVQGASGGGILNASAVVKVLGGIAGFGYLGVDVFFCLSGFLITCLLLIDRPSTAYFHNFYWKRALRILPVYLVHLAATAILFHNEAGYILLSSLFIVNFASPLHVMVVGPAWSLSIEEQFYLVWPQVIRRARLETVYYVAFGLILFSTLSRCIVPLLHRGINLQYTFYRCDGLGLGAVLACQWFSPGGRDRAIAKALAFLNSNLTLVVVIAGVGGLFAGWGSRFVPQMSMTAVAYLTYRLMRFLVVNRERSGEVLAWLGSPVAVYFGAISYALYLYQSFVITSVNFYFGSVPVAHVWALLFRAVLDLALCVAICTVSRFAMELPVQRWRKFVLKPSKPIG